MRRLSELEKCSAVVLVVSPSAVVVLAFPVPDEAGYDDPRRVRAVVFPR